MLSDTLLEFPAAAAETAAGAAAEGGTTAAAAAAGIDAPEARVENPSFLSHREQCEPRGIYLLSVAHSTNHANFVAIVFLYIKQS